MKIFNIFKTLSAEAAGAANSLGKATNETVQGGMNFAFEADKFWKALTWLGEGMFGIFIVTGVIILSVMLLNKLTSPKK